MIRHDIVYFFKKLYEQGAITLYEGNISAKKDGIIYMTPSQQSKETLDENMIVEMAPDGNVICDNGYKPSSEYKMHLKLYDLRDDIGAVVHTHSVYATVFALNGKPMKSDLCELELFFGGEIPCASYGKPGTDEVYRDFEKLFVKEKKDVVLLERHGIVAAGKDVEEAFARAQTAEKIAKISLLALFQKMC